MIHKDEALLEEISKLENYIQAELNVKAVDYDTDEGAYISLYAKPNSPVLGKRLGKTFGAYRQKIDGLSSAAIDELQQQGDIRIDDEVFSVDDILVFREAKAGTDAISDRFISIDLKCELTPALIREGLAREVVNRIQNTRKDLGLNVVDRIGLTLHASPALAAAIAEHREHIMKDTLALQLDMAAAPLATSFDIDDEQLSIAIVRLA